MSDQHSRSGSVPPPVTAANSVASQFAASLAEPGEAAKAVKPITSAPDRSLSSILVPLVGLYFLAIGLFGVVQLIERLPQVTSTPHTSGPGHSSSTSWSVAAPAFGVWWVVLALLALAGVYAGWRILQSDERGRGVGILLGLGGVGFSVYALSRGASTAAVALLAVNAFVLWVLLASRFPQRR
jgi:hypothetical protein